MAKRQEQESASDEVTEVAPNVLRMQLPIHMPGLGHVNCYALVDGEGAALVDPGLPGPLSFRALRARLKQAGLEVRHVHSVIVTHSHPDHFGGAARLAREAGASVIGHDRFMFGFGEPEPEVSVDDLPAQQRSTPEARESPGKLRSPWDGPTPWGGAGPRPPFWRRLRYTGMRLMSRLPWSPVISKRVKGGDELGLAGSTFEVVYTPGHTSDHICLHDRANGVFLAGDHVLPTITPHISGLGANPDPLQSFMKALDEVAALPDVKLALPAHGHPFHDLAQRAHEIQQHHHERLDRVKEIGQQIGPASVQQYTEQLFRRRSWGPMAESETYAHLEHLRLAGEAEVEQTLAGPLYST